MIAGIAATKADLTEWVYEQGLTVLHELLSKDAEEIVGPKGKHEKERTHYHWGSTDGELSFGGGRIQVSRPSRKRSERAFKRDGGVLNRKALAKNATAPPFRKATVSSILRIHRTQKLVCEKHVWNREVKNSLKVANTFHAEQCVFPFSFL